MICRHCGLRDAGQGGAPSSTQVMWCATCTWTVCCQQYPRLNDRGDLVTCVHGGRNGVMFDRMAAEGTDPP